MASSCANLSYYLPSLSKLPSKTTLFLSSLYPSKNFIYNGISLHKAVMSNSRLHAKFEKFEGQVNLDDDDGDGTSQSFTSDPQAQTVQGEVEEEDDSCLPSSLVGAVEQSGQAGANFVSSGGMRAIVELLIPQLQFLDDEGAQSDLWELSRIFLDTLIEETGCQRVKAIFPDAGATALLKYRWKDAAFGFSSLGDRKPVTKEDEIVVMVVPDYQMLEKVERIASELSDDPTKGGNHYKFVGSHIYEKIPFAIITIVMLLARNTHLVRQNPRPLLMWNPRLVSEDVGVGINVRRLRRDFLSTFTVVYSMRPFPLGAVFRCYPGLWKVFYDDKDRPNRYLLAKELISRPDAEELEIIFGRAEEKPEKGSSLFDQAAGIFSSLNRFMKVISR